MKLLSKAQLILIVRGAILGAIAGGIGVGLVGRADPAGRFSALLGSSLGTILGLLAYSFLQQQFGGRFGKYVGSAAGTPATQN